MSATASASDGRIGAGSLVGGSGGGGDDAYVIEREIGRGAMSTVYRAVRKGVPYALKVLASAAAGQAEAALRFRREATALARLNHPGLVKVFEAGEHEGRPYLVIELVEGEELAAVLARGPLSEAAVLQHAKTVAAALAEVHRHGLVHRDIKPSNIVVEKSGAAKIVDFGFVTGASDGTAPREEIAGTFLYAPPEQSGMLKRPVDGRADLYALGATLFECATGRPPFQSSSVAELVHLHATAPAPLAVERNASVRPVLSRIIQKLLAKDPDDRYQTGEGLQNDLENIERLDAAMRGNEPLVLGAGDVRRGRYEVGLVGRSSEVRRLRDMREQAVIARRGSAALLEGEPGSGKSRVIREIVRDAKAAGAVVLQCKCLQGDQVPLGPLRAAIDELASEVLRQKGAERDQRKAEIKKAAGEFAPILKMLSRGLSLILDDVKEGSATALAAEQFYDVIAELFVNIARRPGGALLFVDDVQWIDAASVQVLVRAAAKSGGADGAPLLVLGAVRNDVASAPMRDKIAAQFADAVRVVLPPLDRQAVAELVAAHLGGGLVPDIVVENVATRANGNPFAVGEYVRALLDSGALRPVGGAWQIDATRFATLALPSDVLELVLARVAALSAAAAGVLSTAAVLGLEVQADVLRRVCSESAEIVDRALADAVGSNLLEQIDRGTFAFVHDRVREAMLAPLGDDKLKDLHEAIADVMAAQLATDGGTGASGDTPAAIFGLARHCLAGRPEKNPRRAYQVCMAAGRQALAAHANEDAFQFLSRAHTSAAVIELPPPEKMALEEVLGLACTRTMRVKDAIAHFEKALPLATGLERARMFVNLARVYMITFNYKALGEASQKALDALGTPLPKSKLMRWATQLGYAIAVRAQEMFGLTPAPLAGDEATRVTLLAQTCARWAYLAWAFDYPFSIELLSRIMFYGRRLGDRLEAVEPLSLAAYMDPKALPGGERALRLAQAHGDPAQIASAQRFLAGGRAFAGDVLEGERLDRENFDRNGKWLLPRDFATSVNWMAGYNLLARGRAREALPILQRGLDIIDKTNAAAGMYTVRMALAATESMLGHMADASRHFTEGDALLMEKMKATDRHHICYHAQFGGLFMLEQGELGDRLEKLFAARDALGVGPEDWSAF
ncbi:MAG TPA: protein kinase, partial [Myxococcota bacterium]